MSRTAAARRYAEALADVAIHRGQATLVDQELGEFAELVRTNRDLYSTFASPVVSQKDKLKILNAIIDRTRPSETIVNLLRLLLSHYRLQDLEELHRQFQREMNKREGVVPAEVTTAAPIDGAEQQALRHKLEQMTGKQIQLEFKVDPEAIAGVITRVGSVVYDGSVRTRLQTMKRKLSDAEAGE
jgi:F-type H+-transporting ATPase subunit delta